MVTLSLVALLMNIFLWLAIPAVGITAASIGSGKLGLVTAGIAVCSGLLTFVTLALGV